MNRVNLNESVSDLDNSTLKLKRNELSFARDESFLSDNDKSIYPKNSSILLHDTNGVGSKGFLSQIWSILSVGNKIGRKSFAVDSSCKNADDPEHKLTKEDDSVDLQKCAKKVLKELRDLEKDEIINELLDNHQIRNEDELRNLEEDLRKYFADEYGSGDSETDDQTKTSNRKKIKAGSYIIKQRDPKSIKDSSILSIDMSEIESPSKINIESGILRQNRAKAKPKIKYEPQDACEVFRNVLSTDLRTETSIHRFYTPNEEINMDIFDLYAADRNTDPSLLNVILKKDPCSIFLNERSFYVAKRLYGCFGIIEISFPLSRLIQIQKNNKGDILNFMYYDDETSGFISRNIAIKTLDGLKLLEDVQKQLRYINSSIRILQSGEIDVSNFTF